MPRRTKTEQTIQKPAGLQPPVAWYLQPPAEATPAKSPGSVIRIVKLLVGLLAFTLVGIGLIALMAFMMENRSRLDALDEFDARISDLERERGVPDIQPTLDDITTPATMVPTTRPRLEAIRLKQAAAGGTDGSVIIWVELWDQNNELFTDATTLQATATTGAFGTTGETTQEFTVSNGMGQLLFMPLEGIATITIIAEAREYQSVVPGTLQIDAPSSPPDTPNLTLSIDLFRATAEGVEGQEEGAEATAESETPVFPAGEMVNVTLNTTIAPTSPLPIVFFVAGWPELNIPSVMLDSNSMELPMPRDVLMTEEITAVIFADEQSTVVNVSTICDLGSPNTYITSSEPVNFQGSDGTAGAGQEIIQLTTGYPVEPIDESTNNLSPVAIYLWVDASYVDKDASALMDIEGISAYAPTSVLDKTTLLSLFAENARAYPIEVLSLCEEDGRVLVRLEGVVPDGSIAPVEQNG